MQHLGAEGDDDTRSRAPALILTFPVVIEQQLAVLADQQLMEVVHLAILVQPRQDGVKNLSDDGASTTCCAGTVRDGTAVKAAPRPISRWRRSRRVIALSPVGLMQFACRAKKLP